jgi:hypothetical protein
VATLAARVFVATFSAIRAERGGPRLAAPPASFAPAVVARRCVRDSHGRRCAPRGKTLRRTAPAVHAAGEPAPSTAAVTVSRQPLFLCFLLHADSTVGCRLHNRGAGGGAALLAPGPRGSTRRRGRSWAAALLPTDPLPYPRLVHPPQAGFHAGPACREPIGRARSSAAPDRRDPVSAGVGRLVSSSRHGAPSRGHR